MSQRLESAREICHHQTLVWLRGTATLYSNQAGYKCGISQFVAAIATVLRSREGGREGVLALRYQCHFDNRDDHTKNFSFSMNSRMEWKLASIYDLTFSTGPRGEHQTAVMGEICNPVEPTSSDRLPTSASVQPRPLRPSTRCALLRLEWPLSWPTSRSEIRSAKPALTLSA